MADWGLYSALRGKNNWQQRRADKMMNFQMTEALRAKRERENQQRMQMEAKFLEYQNAIQNLDVLKQDQERVRGVEGKARQNVIAGIAKYDGDINKYMNSGGLQEMNAYQQEVMQSEELSNAVQNKKNMAMYLADRAKGDRWMKSVMVDKEFIDPQTGEKTTRKVATNMEDQMAMFDSGQLSNFQFNGSEKKVAINPALFKKSVKDATNPYSKDNYVTQSNVFDAALMQGASKEQAMQLAEEYGQGVQSGGVESAWRWGAGNPLDIEKLKMQASQFREGMNYKRDYLNQQKELSQYRAKYGNKATNTLAAHAVAVNRKLMAGGDGATSTDGLLLNDIAKLTPENFIKMPQNKDNPNGMQYMYSGPMRTATTNYVDGIAQSQLTGGILNSTGNPVPIMLGDPNSRNSFVRLRQENGDMETFAIAYAQGSAENPIFGAAAANGQAGSWVVGDIDNAITGESQKKFVGLIPVGGLLDNPAYTQALDMEAGYKVQGQGPYENWQSLGTTDYNTINQQNINAMGGFDQYNQMVNNQLGTFYTGSTSAGQTNYSLENYDQ